MIEVLSEPENHGMPISSSSVKYGIAMGVEYELSRKLVERNVLEAELEEAELAESEEYQRLEQRIAELRNRSEDRDTPLERTEWEWGGAQ